MDAKHTVSGYLEEHKNNGANAFIRCIKQALHEGNLDHNIIRRAVLKCFQEQDKKAVVVGSLLLQLDNKEIKDLLQDKF